MEPYHKRKMLEEKIWQIKKPKPYNGDNGTADNKQHKSVKQLQDITGEEGLKRAYGTRDGLHQHYNKSLIAGTKDFQVDHIDDLKLPFDDTLNKNQEGKRCRCLLPKSS